MKHMSLLIIKFILHLSNNEQDNKDMAAYSDDTVFYRSGYSFHCSFVDYSGSWTQNIGGLQQLQNRSLTIYHQICWLY